MSTAHAPAERLDDRYGRGRTTTARRVVWGALAGLGAIAVAVVAWSAVGGALRSVDANALGFTVVDEHSVTVDLQVTVTPGTEVACAVEAQDPEHGIVGLRIVAYPASEAHTRHFTETIPTTAEATTGFVASCWMP